jgi:hypothetical protein
MSAWETTVLPMIRKRPRMYIWIWAVVATFAGCASTAERRTTATRVEPTPMDNVRWDPATGTLGCVASNAQLTLAPALRNRVDVIARDLVVVVLPQASSALLVTISPSYLRGKRAGVLGDLPEIWKELHFQATGVDLREGDLQGELRTRGGRLVVEYTYDPPPPLYQPSQGDFDPPLDRTRGLAVDPARVQQWRLVYVEIERCRIAAVDRTEAGDRPQLTPLVDELRIPLTQ